VHYSLSSTILGIVLFVAGWPAGTLQAEVKQTSANGFQVEHIREVDSGTDETFRKFVEDFGQWYDVNHSYSLRRENLSIDLETHCMLEKLPGGGFVRHLDVVFYQPGKLLRFSGGLGPLQGLGVSGALTFAFQPVEGSLGKTQVRLTYIVSGAEFLQLDKLATPVDSVLGMQLDAFQKYVNR
jgi:hypothetical protein